MKKVGYRIADFLLGVRVRNDGKEAGLKNSGAGFPNFFEEIVFWEEFLS